MITNVRGIFKEFGATVSTHGKENLTADIEFWMNAASIDTNNEMRDTHLKSVEFFDAENFPKIMFKGNRFEKVGDTGNFSLYGVLTIKEISKEVQLDVEFDGFVKDPWGKRKAGYTLHGKISRKDWKLDWNTNLEAGGVLVSDEVKINCDIQLIEQL